MEKKKAKLPRKKTTTSKRLENIRNLVRAAALEKGMRKALVILFMAFAFAICGFVF
jgi:hypothetical protein